LLAALEEDTFSLLTPLERKRLIAAAREERQELAGAVHEAQRNTSSLIWLIVRAAGGTVAISKDVIASIGDKARLKRTARESDGAIVFTATLQVAGLKEDDDAARAERSRADAVLDGVLPVGGGADEAARDG